MSIRLRRVDGALVALCAAETDERPGDRYLDDGEHYALATKFAADHFPRPWRGDHELLRRMETQKVRDAQDEILKWAATQAGGTSANALIHWGRPFGWGHGALWLRGRRWLAW